MRIISDFTRQLLHALHTTGVTLRMDGPMIAIRPKGIMPELKEELRDSKPELLRLVAPGWGQEPLRSIPLASLPIMVDAEDSRMLKRHVDGQGGLAKQWRMDRANAYRHEVGVTDWDQCMGIAAIEVLLEQHCGRLKAKEPVARIQELIIRMRAIEEICQGGGIPTAKTDTIPPGGPMDEALLLIVRATGADGCNLPLNAAVGSLVQRDMVCRHGNGSDTRYTITARGAEWLEELGPLHHWGEEWEAIAA